jgi:hypothetical protein
MTALGGSRDREKRGMERARRNGSKALICGISRLLREIVDKGGGGGITRSLEKAS